MEFGFDGLSCFGKLPIHPEFISGGRTSVTSTGLDRWIAEGLGAARAAWGADYDRHMSALPAYDFAWPASGGGLSIIAGRMLPSRDLRGRHHPFVIFSVPLSGNAAAGPLPIRWAPFRAHLARAVESLSGATSVDEVKGRICRPDRIDGEPDGRERYRAFLDEPAERLWSRIEASGTTRHQIMQALLESLDPFRGREIERIPIGIRFPLAEDDPDRRIFEVSFWIELTAGRLGRSLDRAPHFWSVGGEAGERPVLFLFFAIPSGQQFTALVERDLDLDSISYLERPYGKQPPEERMPDPLRELLSRPATSLHDILRWVARG